MNNQNVFKSLIIGLSVLLSALVLGNAFKKRNATLDSISVVGLGAKQFTSDEILFSGSYSVKAMDAKEAYAQMLADKEKVQRFFINKGFQAKEINFSGVSFEKSYRTLIIETGNDETKSEQIFDGYIAKQNISLTSKKNPELMQRIEAVADQTAELINSGIEFNPNAVQYTYSDLPSLKHDLIVKATQDAKERADKIIKTAEGKRGKLKTASMGVFQITGEGSDEEDSSGGNNDIYSKQKSARITVRLEYELE